MSGQHPVDVTLKHPPHRTSHSPQPGGRSRIVCKDRWYFCQGPLFLWEIFPAKKGNKLVPIAHSFWGSALPSGNEAGMTRLSFWMQYLPSNGHAGSCRFGARLKIEDLEEHKETTESCSWEILLWQARRQLLSETVVFWGTKILK